MDLINYHFFMLFIPIQNKNSFHLSGVMASTTRTIRKVLHAFASEQRPLSKSHLIAKYGLNHSSVTDALGFLLEHGIIKELNASSLGKLYIYDGPKN